MKKLASTISAALLVAVLAVGLAATGAAEESDEETTVDVEVGSVTELDVRPTSLDYTDSEEDLEPGDMRTESDLEFEHIEVENIGSNEIGNIWTEANMPTEDPFGDEEASHNTGNFVTVSLATAQDESYGFGGELSDTEEMHYLNRVEYFEETAPTYIQTLEEGDEYAGTGDDVNTEPEVGRFRVGGAEYFFVYFETANDQILLIGDAPHTSTDLGTTDFTNEGDDYSEELLTNSDDETEITGVYQVTEQDLVDFDTDSEDFEGQRLIEDGNENFDDLEIDPEDIDASVREYNLYVDSNDDFVTRTRFNVEQQNPEENERTALTTSGAQEYFLDASSSSESLQPGENFPINFGVQVPLGVDAGDIDSGSVTVFSEAFE